MIARVFPRKTKATPDDDLAFFDPPGLFPPEVDEVHVSVAFTYDKYKAEWLAHQWEHIAPVSIGGPAYGQPSGDFIPGRYVKPGYVITSRGCPNNCWFCSVWRREPELIELPINDGWNVLDDNLLACSEGHIRAVFDMLKRQNHRVEFTGGLEAALLKPWHIDLLCDLRPKQFFFAYDGPEDFDPLKHAAKMIIEAGFSRDNFRCYVLIGFPKDDMLEAEHRLQTVWKLGALPMAMLWRDETGNTSYGWRKFARAWARPAIIKSKANKLRNN